MDITINQMCCPNTQANNIKYSMLERVKFRWLELRRDCLCLLCQALHLKWSYKDAMKEDLEKLEDAM